jgi:hypothetical protein
MGYRATNNVSQSFMDRKLPDPNAGSVSDQHNECTISAMQHKNALTVIEALKGIHVPPSSPGFSARVIENATKTKRTRIANLLRYVTSGIAASFIILAVLVSTFSSPVFESQDWPVVFIDGEFQIIKVAINSAHSIDSVEMTVQISDNLAIEGYENQKHISWNTNLSQGVNVIALPVSAIALGDGEITTRVRLNGKERIFTIKTRYPSPEILKRDLDFIVNT